MSQAIALFPLSQIVLPQGRMQLRVFEPRYQRLVREAQQRPFASALLNPYVHQQHQSRIFPVVTLVKIIDFCQLPDGLLGITIEGIERHRVVKRWQEADQLHVAETEALPQWPSVGVNSAFQQLVPALQEIYLQNPQLAALYPTPDWQNASWLAQRWLEVLTMPPQLKFELMSADDAGPTLDVLQDWLSEQQPSPQAGAAHTN
ncbi:MAG: peptidase S16 [Rheinheimera sp.]|nr:MAG: peptidase S16 [Rheinheimera sp.]